RRRHTRFSRDWSSDVCSSDLKHVFALVFAHLLLDLGVDALAHLQDLELTREQAQDLTDALFDVDSLDELSFLFDRRVEVRRDKIDRKSTRLNSSHVKISYAVF